MSNYYDRPDAEALIMLEIEANKEVLELYDGIIEVVRAFDGKVFNKRFEAALQAKVSENIHANNGQYGYFRFYYSIRNRSVKSINHDFWNYLEHSYICLITGDESACFTEEKRICADVMIEKLEQRRASIEEETKALEDGLGRIDEWIDRQRTLETEIQKLRKEIPHSFKDYITELHVPRIF